MHASPVEVRERDRAESWLAAGLALVRVGPQNAHLGPRLAPWLEGVLSETGALPPIGVLADIGHLVSGASLRELAPLPPLDPDLAQVIHAYEDHVLGRLDADPRLDAIIDALAGLPADKRDRGVALFAGHLCKRLGFRAAVAISPGAIREFMARPIDEIMSRGYAVLSERGDIAQLLLAGYRDLIGNARRRGSLISEAEIFLVENLDVLGDLTQRLAIAQIIEVADALGAAIPRRLKPNTRFERARVTTELAAADNYPTGGFSALSTSGTMENLVSSELIYMEDGAPDDVDLFDVRYAEGELLYYTRDESVFVRGHRVVAFVFMPDLVAARFKDKELAWQRLIVLCGLVTSCVRRLAEWLAHEGLSFHVLFVADARAGDPGQPPPRPAPLATERGLIELALREFMAKEMLHIHQVESLDDALGRAAGWAENARTDVVLMSVERPAVRPPPGVLLGTLCVADAEPDLLWGATTEARARAAATPTAPGSHDASTPWPAWLARTLELLQALL